MGGGGFILENKRRARFDEAIQMSRNQHVRNEKIVRIRFIVQFILHSKPEFLPVRPNKAPLGKENAPLSKDPPVTSLSRYEA